MIVCISRVQIKMAYLAVDGGAIFHLLTILKPRPATSLLKSQLILMAIIMVTVFAQR